MTGTKAILGFIAGVSIGAIAGILLSPEKGSATRQRIADRTADFCNSIKDGVTHFIKGKKSGEKNNDEYVPSMNVNTIG